MIRALTLDPAALAPRFAAAAPFPHVVLDGFLEERAAHEVAAAFPVEPDATWTARHHLHSRKWTLSDIDRLPWPVVHAFAALHRSDWIDWLERLTGIRPLHADPDLYGGGMHVSTPGSFLDVHADFTQHPVMKERRALNILLYLSPDWEPAWGGHLELWGHDMRRCVRSIAPRFNRAVIFATSATSFHGHPTPMAGAPTARRCSLAGYYYTPWRPGEPVSVATTDYRPRPQDWEKRARKLARRVLRAVGMSRR